MASRSASIPPTFRPYRAAATRDAAWLATRALRLQAQRTVVYTPGNHNAEAWSNQEIRDQLERAGLVHELEVIASVSKLMIVFSNVNAAASSYS